MNLKHRLLSLTLALFIVAAISKLQDDSAKSSPIDGTYGTGSGFSYFGQNLELENGRYTQTFYSCTDSGTSSQGEYQIDNKVVTLIDARSGESSKLSILSDGLRPMSSRYRPPQDFIKTAEIDGALIDNPRILKGPFTAPPAPEPELVIQGEALYRKHCAGCHGADGQGLTNTSLEPSPISLTRKEAYRHGAELEETYRSIKHGIDGTDMPWWRDRLEEREIWELCYFLESIQDEKLTKLP